MGPGLMGPNGEGLEGGVEIVRVKGPEHNIAVAESALEHIAGRPLDTIQTMWFALAHATLAQAKVNVLVLQGSQQDEEQGGEET